MQVENSDTGGWHSTLIPDGNKTGKAVYIVTLKRILAKLLFPPKALLASVSCPVGILDVLKFVYDTPIGHYLMETH